MILTLPNFFLHKMTITPQVYFSLAVSAFSDASLRAKKKPASHMACGGGLRCICATCLTIWFAVAYGMACGVFFLFSFKLASEKADTASQKYAYGV